MSLRADVASGGPLPPGRTMLALMLLAVVSNDNDVEYLTGVTAPKLRDAVSSGCRGHFGDPETFQMAGAAAALATAGEHWFVGLISALLAHVWALTDKNPLNEVGNTKIVNTLAKRRGFFNDSIAYTRRTYPANPAKTAFAIGGAAALSDPVWLAESAILGTATAIPEWFGMFGNYDARTGSHRMSADGSKNLLATVAEVTVLDKASLATAAPKLLTAVVGKK